MRYSFILVFGLIFYVFGGISVPAFAASLFKCTNAKDELVYSDLPCAAPKEHEVVNSLRKTKRKRKQAYMVRRADQPSYSPGSSATNPKPHSEEDLGGGGKTVVVPIMPF